MKTARRTERIRTGEIDSEQGTAVADFIGTNFLKYFGPKSKYGGRLQQGEYDACMWYHQAHEINWRSGTPISGLDGAGVAEIAHGSKTPSERALEASELIREADKRLPVAGEILKRCLLSDLTPSQAGPQSAGRDRRIRICYEAVRHSAQILLEMKEQGY